MTTVCVCAYVLTAMATDAQCVSHVHTEMEFCRGESRGWKVLCFFLCVCVCVRGEKEAATF